MKHLFIASFFALIHLGLFAQSLSGTTLSYTERLFMNDYYIDVTTYFTFVNSTEVVWLLETQRGFVFPVGFGMYNPETQKISFPYENKLHQKISLYYPNEDIEFQFDSLTNQAKLNEDDVFLSRYYNQGNSFTLTKERATLKPNDNLVGSSWVAALGDEKYILYFKSRNEVLLDGISHAYVCIGNSVAIKSGDNIADENLVGIFYPGANTITLQRDGLDKEEWNNDLSIKFAITRLE